MNGEELDLAPQLHAEIVTRMAEQAADDAQFILGAGLSPREFRDFLNLIDSEAL